MVNGDLTDKQRRFVDEYLIDLNAKQAVIRTKGYSNNPDSAKVTGSRLLSDANVFNEIMKRTEARQKRTEVTQDMVIKELARIAFLDIRDLYDENGALIPIHKLSRDTAAAIGGMDVVSVGGQDFIDTKKIKLIDKKGSLELLGRHMQMFTDKVDLNVSGTLTMAEAIRQRDAKTNN